MTHLSNALTEVTPNQKSEIDDLDDYSLTEVPPDQKRSTFSIMMVLAGICVVVSGMFKGAALASGLSLMEVVLVTLAGNTILFIYSGLIGAIGANHGVSTTVIARHAFGRMGANVIGACLALTLIGWFSVQSGFFGKTIHLMMPEGTFLFREDIATVWGGLLMMTTAYFGYRGIALMSQLAVPAILLLGSWGVLMAVEQAGGWAALFDFIPQSYLPLSQGVTMVVGGFAVGGVIQADITRYAKNAQSSWIAVLFGLVVTNTVIALAGAISVLSTGTGDLPAAMVGLGLAGPGLFVLIGSQWTTNDNNLYSSSLALSNLFRIKKTSIVLITGMVATLVGYMGIADHFVKWLLFLGILLPPVAGVIISDYYLLRRQNYRFGEGTHYSRLNWPAFVAWATGSAAGYFIAEGIPSINAILTAAFTHFLLVKGCTLLNITSEIGSYTEEKGGF